MYVKHTLKRKTYDIQGIACCVKHCDKTYASKATALYLACVVLTYVHSLCGIHSS